MSIKILSENYLETRKIGRKLAKRILGGKTGKAAVLGLLGDLGSGKTTFIQGFAGGLGIKERITSPTFVVVKRYAIEPVSRIAQNFGAGIGKGFQNFYHIDLYRIKKVKEILDLGWREMISPGNIVAIEWPDRLKKIMPKDAIWIEFKFVNGNARRILFKSDKLFKEVNSKDIIG